jgi:hypothetical protein
VEITCRVYRPRDPRKTPLYGLLESLYERVKGAWEERFERSYGFWRGLVGEVVASSRAVSGKAASQGFAAGGVPRSSWSPSPASIEECAHRVEPSGRRE